MAQFTINIRSDNLKDEIENAFSASFANPDSLTEEQLVVLHVSNYIRQILNAYRKDVAVATALSDVIEESTLV